MKKLFLIIALVFSLFSCKQNSDSFLISDKAYLKEVQDLYQNVLKTYPKEVTDSIKFVGESLKGAEQQAYQFLYAYMPIGDLADYTPEFYKNIVQKTFEAKSYFTWGKQLPEDLFLHFVLPYRVNNEDLDTARAFFFHSLQTRLNGMSMLDAALEVNHWCHEHVAYQSADDRTRAPLATYFNGLGRCGEESTFAVTALRSVGIPARQVYTPRWAHQDDNHAWVEFWADGKWYYLGACEPEAEPNLGWFSEPARRAMLVNTRVLGKYHGSENILETSDKYCILNTLEVYAKTKTIYVKVLDANQKPIEGAKVDFQLYNYAEFFSLTSQKTDKGGIASFKTGLGDLMIWATDSVRFASQKISVSATDTLVLVLDKTEPQIVESIFDVYCPIAPTPIEHNPKNKEANAKRLVYEDSLRSEYEKTFIDSNTAFVFAKKVNLPQADVWTILKKSRANYKEIMAFIEKSPANLRPNAMLMLQNVEVKDLNDTKSSMFLNHLINSIGMSYDDLPEPQVINKYLSNPRISWEIISPWRGELRKFFIKKNITSPEGLYKWIQDSIKLVEEKIYNHSGNPISPLGVLKIRMADRYSFDILTIATLRDFGYPARFEPGTNLIQFYNNNEWNFIEKKANSKIDVSTGILTLISDKSNKISPQYYKHFTLAKLTDGKFITMEYDWDKDIKAFPEKIALNSGYYRVMSGNRQPDGSVLLWWNYFKLEAGKTTKVIVKLRNSSLEVKSMGNFDVSKIPVPYSKQESTIKKSDWKVVCWINPTTEPTRHCMEDISAMAKLFQSKGAELFLLSPEKLDIRKLDTKYFGNLPVPNNYSTDANLALLKEVENTLKINAQNHLPLIILVNSKGEIIYYSTGYKIGIGEELVKLMENKNCCGLK